jgi:hypothetical protein
MEILDVWLWVIGLALDELIEKRETLQTHGMKTGAIFCNSQNAIQ